MPYIHLRVAGKLTQSQRKRIARDFSETLFRVAKKPKNSTYLVVEEVPRDRWAVGERFLNETK